MQLIIPKAPDVLPLPITTSWDGTPCSDRHLHGVVTLCMEAEGVRITGSLAFQHPTHIPQAALLSRVANLWEYDVVECFLAGKDGYLEVELGASGHFLVLAFTAPRRLANAYETFVPQMTYDPGGQDGGATWVTSLVIPWEMLPRAVQGVNAYVSSGGRYLSYQRLPGEKANFHQPERFPAVRLAHCLDESRLSTSAENT